MSKIVDFVCLRIRSEIDKYIETGEIPDILLEGFFTIEEMTECISNANPLQSAALNEVLAKINEIEAEKSVHVKNQMKKEYRHTMTNLKTNSSDFMFPTVLARYRNNLNPIRALYYELKEIFAGFNPDNDRHIWLLSLFHNHGFNQQLTLAISKDIEMLYEFFDKYNNLLSFESSDIPLELFHARELIKDYQNFCIAFNSALKWHPDD